MLGTGRIRSAVVAPAQRFFHFAQATAAKRYACGVLTTSLPFS
jgi:hypothetical protein